MEKLTSTIQELRKSLDNQERKSEAMAKELKSTIQKLQNEIERKATIIRDETVREKDDEIVELQKQLDLEQQKGILNQKISRSEIQRIPKHQIGSGAWGVVYSAKFRGENVAINCPSTDSSSHHHRYCAERSDHHVTPAAPKLGQVHHCMQCGMMLLRDSKTRPLSCPN